MIWPVSLVSLFTIVFFSGHLLCLHSINRKIRDQPIRFSSTMFSFVFMPSLFRYIPMVDYSGLSIHGSLVQRLWIIYPKFYNLEFKTINTYQCCTYESNNQKMSLPCRIILSLTVGALVTYSVIVGFNLVEGL